MGKENTEAEKITEFPQDEGETVNREENSLIVKFNKPYKFEGNTYTEIDLSGLEDMNTKDLEAVNREVGRVTGSSALIPEASTEFAIALAARAAKQPIEFFELLPMKDGIAVRAAVTGFLLM